MKQMLTVAALLTCIALPAAAQKPATRSFFYCVSIKIGEPTSYIGGPYAAPGGDAAAIARDFREYVRERYSPEVTLGAGCYGFATFADAALARIHRIAELLSRQDVVEVDWQNRASPSAGRATVTSLAARPEAPVPPARQSSTQSADLPPATNVRSGG